MAEAKANKKAQEVQEALEPLAAENTEHGKEYWEERVPLMIPRDPSNPMDADAVIIINGMAYQIKKGEQVMVPRKVYQVYMDSVAQKNKFFDTAEKRKDRN